MTAQQMWERYCTQSNTDINTPYEAWAYGAAPDNLLALTILGTKTGTASAYELYALDPDEPVPQVGDYSVILDSREQAQCIIVTTKTAVLPFEEVDALHAASEGEGDRSLAYWRRVHEDFFTKELAEYNLCFSNRTPVLCERFQVVYSLYQVSHLTEKEAKEVCSWRYSDIYSVYNYPSWEECMRLGWSITNETKRQQEFFAVTCEGQFLALFRIMDRGDHVELGVGMKPEYCGQGNGRMLTELALAKIEELYGQIPVQLLVRTFNTRAIACYEKVGFEIVSECSSPETGPLYQMRLER
ncbi:MAG: GNAT family N-acetyltransferase [Sphaerochaetaceae bacterium]|nr:GNAT family N-acetyltransferase [Sphaerochaetaceae bacterium]